MKQFIKNIKYQIRRLLFNKFWTDLTIHFDDEVSLYLIERSIKTGESINQIVEELLKKYIREKK